MDKIITSLKSRTFWTAVATLAVNTIPAVRNSIPGSLLPVVDAILFILTAYFHVTPSQSYTSPVGSRYQPR